MQSSQNYIPTTHRQPSDELNVLPAAAGFFNNDLQFFNANRGDFDQTLSLDDEFGGVFELDDLDVGVSIPRLESAALGPIPPPIVRDNIYASPIPAWEDAWTRKSVIQTQPIWDPSYNRVASAGSPIVNHQSFDNMRSMNQRQLLFGEIWPGRTIRNLMSFDLSAGSQMATSTFSGRESPGLSSIPSLGTNRSSGPISWESPPEVPAIYGASQWPGINSYAATNINENLANARVTTLPQIDQEERSSGLESLCGSSPVIPLEGNGAQSPSWFNYGNQVTQPQGISHFVEQWPSIPDISSMVPMAAMDFNNVSQLFDSVLETHDPGYGNTNGPGLVQESSMNVSFDSKNLIQYTPRSGLTSFDSGDLSPSDGIEPCPPRNNSSPIGASNPQQFTFDQQSAPQVNYDIVPHENAYFEPVPYIFPEALEVHKTEGQVDDENMQEKTWNCFVIEDGSGSAVTPPSHRRKGVRHGHLPPVKAKITAQRRKEGKTCIRCKIARMECDGHDPCGRCKKLGQPATLTSPCIKANFLDIVKSGTCNYISQRNINHFTLDESRRIKIVLPETFAVNELLGSLASRKQKFNIRARSALGSLYVLDLAKCYDFLNTVKRKSSPSDGGLRSFIDNTLLKTDSWHKCVKECDPSRNKTLLLSQWNNMPSRASYDLVAIDGDSSDRPLDPEDENDKQNIMIAAQLSRIICRKLEIDGYKALQAEINNMRTHNSTYHSRKQTVEQTGKILLSLRWRMSWWKLLGDGSNHDDIFRNRFVERVEHLTKVLYFYYFGLKARIGPWVDPSGLKGEVSSYPDAEPIFDDFPTVQSIQGFEEWLKRGESLIMEANVERRFSG